MRSSNNIEHQYLALMNHLLNKSKFKADRTGTGTYSMFGPQIQADLREGFPLLTTKKVFLKAITYELLWFLKGLTNIEYLSQHNVKIWDEWALENGELGPIYGKMWRSWPSKEGQDVDQIAYIIDLLKNKPYSRRQIVCGWNPSLLPVEGVSHEENILAGRQALPPCHTLFQFYVEDMDVFERVEHLRKDDPSVLFKHPEIEELLEEHPKKAEEILNVLRVKDKYLSCKLYQRSGDIFLGVPFNIASYALLTHMVAQVVNMVPKDFIHTFGDLHLYSNHVEQAKEQLGREPDDLPTLKIKDRGQAIDEFEYEDFEIVDYNPQDYIKAPVAI